jgi:hypothetical protein
MALPLPLPNKTYAMHFPERNRQRPQCINVPRSRENWHHHRDQAVDEHEKATVIVPFYGRGGVRASCHIACLTIVQTLSQHRLHCKSVLAAQPVNVDRKTGMVIISEPGRLERE